MSRAWIEDVVDSDSDPSEGNISDLEDGFNEHDILKARPSQISPVKPNLATKSSSQHLIDPSAISAQRPSTFIAPDGTKFQAATDEDKYKNFQCLYPVYFDKNRSRAEGRRVRRENAVESPLAREIVVACGRLRLDTLFDPAKRHPKDWANPGRVKVGIKGANNPLVNNSQSIHIFALAQDLRVP
jgi:signal recognition particle subunit SRP19